MKKKKIARDSYWKKSERLSGVITGFSLEDRGTALSWKKKCKRAVVILNKRVLVKNLAVLLIVKNES